jgi:hypothetical protein
VVSRGYALQRYVTACAGRGAFPIKFNGSLFTVDWPAENVGPDYRRWGPGYWWQNTRLPYYPMLAAGDLEMMKPLFEMYVDRLLPIYEQRTQRYFDHGGAFYSEICYFWGAVISDAYRWTPWWKRDNPLQYLPFHKREWTAGPELTWLALEYYHFTGDRQFLKQTVLPVANATVRFFDEHFETGPDGKLLMKPAQALETWWEATNPMPDVAGLHAVLDRLLGLPKSVTKASDRKYWRAVRDRLPAYPTRQHAGERMLAPGRTFANHHNSETPEMYAVFPFRRFGVGRPTDIGLAKSALRHRWHRGHTGWRQADVNMAYLGLAQKARRNVVARARERYPHARFHAFWQANHDWIPDQDHGSILTKALQSMILQWDDEGTLYLLPAWPKQWNVDFKLHGPKQTTVTGRYENGELKQLQVSPSERRQDLVVWPNR